MNTMMRYAALNEARKRDGRGRFTSEGDNNMYAGGIDNRFRDKTGREHYDDGRFAPRNDMNTARYEMGNDSYSNKYHGDHVWESDNTPSRMEYAPTTARDTEMRLIGFDNRSEYRAPQRMNEFEHRASPAEHRPPSTNVVRMIDKTLAEEWMAKLQNADGSTGAKWPFEQAKQFMQQKGIKADPLEFWVTLNMMYSDYSEVGKKFSLPSPDFYAYLAAAFLDDEDSQGEKLARYYACIVK